MKKGDKSPTVYVIAGPNGAGKTTFASQFLPKFVHCREFLNADLIARGLAPFAPETQNLRAGRLLLERIDELSSQKATFAFETTLSGRTYVNILSKMKAAGYRVALFFLWLPSADVAVERVAQRVRQGGHGVAEQDIRRRVESGLQNFFHRYRPLADTWRFYDASQMPPKLIAGEEGGKLFVKARKLFKVTFQAELE